MKKSILLSLALVGVLSANCVSNGDKTVTCSDTKLMWQDDSGVGSVSKTWKEAIEYCEDLDLAGYDDWRLPNINELLSIIDKSKYNPALKDGFVQRSTNWFWSSTTRASYTDYAWLVGFYYGDDTWNDKSFHNSVRCVR